MDMKKIGYRDNIGWGVKQINTRFYYWMEKGEVALKIGLKSHKYVVCIQGEKNVVVSSTG